MKDKKGAKIQQKSWTKDPEQSINLSTYMSRPKFAHVNKKS